MSDIPDGYSIRSTKAMDLEPGDIIRGQGGGVVDAKPIEERDPIRPEQSHAVVRFEDGTSALYLPTQNIEVYRQRKPWPPAD